jgi:hypothetical protein
MFELSDPDRGLLEQTYALRFRLKFASKYTLYPLLKQKARKIPGKIQNLDTELRISNFEPR